MRTKAPWLMAGALVLIATPAVAQQLPPAVPPPAAAAPANAVAATVNGQVIPETALQRALRRVPPARQAEARPELIGFLIDNALVDQYLSQQAVTVDPKEVEAKLREVADDIKKEGSTFDKVMQDLMLSPDELRAQITAQLRWDKFSVTQATDKALKDLFDQNKEMFDGTVVHARHILLTPSGTDPKASADAKTRLVAVRQQIEAGAAQAVAKLPATADNLAKQQARAKAVEEAFVAVAAKESSCPSKAQGGDLGWFPRAGNMVEPFAKAAFSLQPYEMSDVVTTQFGHHLVLVVDRRAGKEVKYDDVKDEVREVFFDRLRESVLAKLRPTAKVVISPPPKS